MTATHKKSLRISHRLSIILIAFFFLCSVSFYYVTGWPQYIKLDVDLPGKNDWSYTEKIVRSWHDTRLKYFIYRQATAVYQHPPDNFTSWESVINVFDQHFAKTGWKRLEGYWSYSPCHYMPETAFLEEGEGGFVVYMPQDWNEFDLGHPTICLAVWPMNSYDGYYVVLLSVNPSPLAKFVEMME